MTDPTPPEVLFAERGASWLWLLAGPGSAIAMAVIQITGGVGFEPVVPLAFFVLVTAFLAVQVKAARTHTSVELTTTTLRQGAEIVRIGDIVRIYPEATGNEAPAWQSARALGELTGVPRGRTGIGLRLSSDRTAQAWARRHQQLRTALTQLLDERTPREPTA